MRTERQSQRSARLRDDIRFFKNWVHDPKSTGALVPTGPILARAMAQLVNPASSAPVLELGPGTGVITKAILDTGLPPNQLNCVEYSAGFVARLRLTFSKSRIVQGDAFALDQLFPLESLQPFQTVVSALPLLNFPAQKRDHLLDTVLQRLQPGQPFVQFSYGLTPPIRCRGSNETCEPHDWIFRNIPPARIWVYRRNEQPALLSIKGDRCDS